MADAVLERRRVLREQREAAKAAAEAARSFEEGVRSLIQFAQPPPLPPTPHEEMGLNTPGDIATYETNLARLNQAMAGFLKRNTAETFDQSLAELFKIGLQELCCLAFGTERIALWITRKGTVRKIFEQEDPEDQCNGTIGEAGVRPCWICGMEIDPTETHPTKAQIAAGKTTNPFAPECEHILPIAQAAIFIDLFKRTPEGISGDRSYIYELEYDWAHSACNQTKSDEVYVDGVLAAPVGPFASLPLIDTNDFNGLLKRILAGSRDNREGEFVDALRAYIASDYGEPGVSERTAIKEWKEDRMEIFTDKYEAIYRFINNINKAAAPGLFTLALISCAMQLPNRIKDREKRIILGLPVEAEGGSRRRKRRTRRRTSSFLPYRRRRSYHAIRTSSKRRPVVDMADSF
jgi:hypothetical protein